MTYNNMQLPKVEGGPGMNVHADAGIAEQKLRESLYSTFKHTRKRQLSKNQLLNASVLPLYHPNMSQVKSYKRVQVQFKNKVIQVKSTQAQQRQATASPDLTRDTHANEKPNTTNILA